MSTYIISDATISYIVSAALNYGVIGETNHDSSELCVQLIKENYNSINAKYREDNKPHTVDFKYFAKTSPATVYAQINHLNYQSCEHEGWKESYAYDVLNKLKDACFNQLVNIDGEPSGIDDNKVKKSEGFIIGINGIEDTYELID